MPRKIVICSQKGGVGKTTTTVNLATALVKMGKKVLVVDLDSQGETTIAFGFDKRKIGLSTYDLLTNSSINAQEVIRHTGLDALWLIPSCSELACADIELVRELGREFILREKLNDIEDQFDYILVDCVSGINLLSINALFFANEIIIPVQAHYYALEGIDQLFDTLITLREKMHHPISLLGIVCTMFDRRTQLSHQMLYEIHKLFDKFLFNSLIYINVKLAEAPIRGQSIFSYAPKTGGAKSYTKLAQEVVDREKPFQDWIKNTPLIKQFEDKVEKNGKIIVSFEENVNDIKIVIDTFLSHQAKTQAPELKKKTECDISKTANMAKTTHTIKEDKLIQPDINDINVVANIKPGDKSIEAERMAEKALWG